MKTRNQISTNIKSLILIYIRVFERNFNRDFDNSQNNGSTSRMPSISSGIVCLAALISAASAVAIYEQCAGEGYGNFPCNAGLTCFRRNKWYSSCQYRCPLNVGWECETLGHVGPAPTIAAGWDQCGGNGWAGPAACAAGFACYARSVHYAQVSIVFSFHSS